MRSGLPRPSLQMVMSAARKRNAPWSSSSTRPPPAKHVSVRSDSDFRDSSSQESSTNDNCVSGDNEVVVNADPTPAQRVKKVVIPKPPGKVYDHISRSVENGQFTFCCKYCRKSWTMTCGRDVIGLRRHSLLPETISALMLGKSALKF